MSGAIHEGNHTGSRPARSALCSRRVSALCWDTPPKNTLGVAAIGVFKAAALSVEKRETQRESRANAVVDNLVSNTTCPDMVAIGTRVEIRNLHRHTWIRGFQVAAIIDETYLIRRLADGRILPRFFASVEIRVAPAALRGGDVTS